MQQPYPQMPPLTDEERRTFLDTAPVARLGSRNPDGSIHIVPVMFRRDGDDLVIGTQLITRKVRNIEENAQVSVLVDNEAPPFKGVLIYGRAELDRDDVVRKRIEVFERYMPTENATALATGLANLHEPVIVRVRADSVTSWDYAKVGFIQTALATVG